MASFAEDSSQQVSLSKLDRAYLFCEFFECFVHQVLFSRNLYDSRLFETRRLYGLFLKKSLNPALNAYIHDTVYSLKEVLSGDGLDSLEVLFLTPQRQIVETGVAAEVQELTALETAFRSLLTSVVKILPTQAPLPADCAFELSVKTRSQTLPSRLKPFWHLQNLSPQSTQQEMLPIKTVKISLFCECAVRLVRGHDRADL